MADVATHVRIFEGAPGDDLVTKRIAVAKDLGAKFLEEKDTISLLSFADGIARACVTNGTMLPDLAGLVEASIRAQSTSFISAGNELQLLTMALLGLDQAITSSVPAAALSRGDVLATGAWLSLSLQPVCKDPKLEALRTEVMSDARALSLASASRGRQRQQIDQLKLEPLGADLSIASDKINAVINAPISTLRENAILDREEIDFLWWALSDYSPCMERTLSSLSSTTAALAAGFDAAQLLRRLPANGHRHVVLRHVRDHKSYALNELVKAVGTDSNKLSALAADQHVQKFPSIFGLLAALSGHAASPAGSGQPEPMADWASRALTEAGFLRILNLLPGAKV